MNYDSESTMAIDSAFNSIITGIQLSKLNFAVQLTPFAAYTTLKRSTQVDRNGVPAIPSPPLCILLQQSYKDLSLATEEIKSLRAALKETNQRCEDHATTNAALLVKLKAADDRLVLAQEKSCIMEQKLNDKEKEVVKLEVVKKDIESEFKINKKESEHFRIDTENQIKNLQKNNKMKEKEVYNLEKILANCRDTVSNLKAEVSQLKHENSKMVRDTNCLNNQLKKLTFKKECQSTCSQTNTTLDTPYSINEELPPIFGSQLCVQTKPPFMSRSLPNIKNLVFVEVSEETLIRDAAEEALSLQYDKEIAHFYEEAKIKASNVRKVYEENAIGLLFEQS